MYKFFLKHFFIAGIAVWLLIWILGTVGGVLYTLLRANARCGEHPCDPHGMGFVLVPFFTFMASLFVGIFAGGAVALILEMRARKLTNDHGQSEVM